MSSFKDWVDSEFKDDMQRNWFLNYESDLRNAFDAGVEASAELVYEMKFMANEHVAKLIRGLKDGS